MILVRLAQGCLLLVVLSVVAACAQRASFEGTSLPARPAPNFTLTDQYEQPWTLSAQRGTEIALYFGYTHCPDECPTTIAKLARAVAELHGHKAEVAFVTVDPARDTPARLRTYVEKFKGGPIVGLTGSPRRLASVYHAYHVWAQRIPGDIRVGYEVAHATPVFLIDANGNLRVLHDDSDPRTAFLHDMSVLGT
jgi:protein SCO1/2